LPNKTEISEFLKKTVVNLNYNQVFNIDGLDLKVTSSGN
jgi:hypothetical protein